MPSPFDDIVRKAAQQDEFNRLESEANLDEQIDKGEFSYTIDPTRDISEQTLAREKAERQYLEGIQNDPKKLAKFQRMYAEPKLITGQPLSHGSVYQDIPDDHSRYGELKEAGLTVPGTDLSLYDKMMYDRQGTATALGKMLNGFFLQAASGFVSSIATRNPSEIAATGFGTDDETAVHGGVLSQFADYLMDKAQEQTLFLDYNDPNRFWQWGRADSTVQGLGLIGGIGLEMALETIAVAAITKGLGSAAHAGSLAARGAATVARLTRAGKFLRNASKIAKYTAMGAWQGAGEAVMNAREVSKKVYDELIADGYEEGRALKIAAQAGKENFQTEVLPTIGLQLVQNALILSKLHMAKPSIRSAFVAENSLTANAARGTYGVSSTLENLGERLFGRIKNKKLRGAATYAFGGVTEGAEEMFQTGVNQYVEDDVLTKHGLMWERSTSDKFFNQEMMDSALGGVFGGLVFGASGHISASIANRHARRQQRQLEERVRDFSQHRLDLLHQLEEAKKRNDQASIIALENAIDMHTMEYVLMADAVRHNDVQLNTHLSFLHTALEAVDNNDQATLDKMGLGGMDKQFIKDNFEHLVDSAIEIRDRFDHYYGLTDGHLDLAMHLTRYESRRNAQQDAAAFYEGALNQVLDIGRQAYRAQLSGENQQAYDLYERRALMVAEMHAAHAREQELPNRYTGHELSEHQRMIQERISELQQGINQVDGEIQGLSANARAYSKAHLTQWMQMWPSDAMQNVTGLAANARANVAFMDQEITRWSNPANQRAFEAFRIREHMSSLNVDHDLDITEKYLRKKRKGMRRAGGMTVQDEQLFDELLRRVRARDEAIANGTFSPQLQAGQQQAAGNQQAHTPSPGNGPQASPPQGPQNGPTPPAGGGGVGGTPQQAQNVQNGRQNAQGGNAQGQQPAPAGGGNPPQQPQSPQAQGANQTPNAQPQGGGTPPPQPQAPAQQQGQRPPANQAQPNQGGGGNTPQQPAQAQGQQPQPANPTPRVMPLNQAMWRAANALGALRSLVGQGRSWAAINGMRKNDPAVETAFQLAQVALEDLARSVKAQGGSGSLYDRVLSELVQGIGRDGAQDLESVFSYVWNRSNLPKGRPQGAMNRVLNQLGGVNQPAPPHAQAQQQPRQRKGKRNGRRNAAAQASPAHTPTPSPAPASPNAPAPQVAPSAPVTPAAPNAQVAPPTQQTPAAPIASAAQSAPSSPTSRQGQPMSQPIGGGGGDDMHAQSIDQAAHESKRIISPEARVHVDTARHQSDGRGGVTDADNATDEGHGAVNKHPLSEEIDQKPVLDPNQMGPGTKLEVEVPEGFEQMQVPLYGEDGKFISMVTFEQYLEEMEKRDHDVSENSDVYWDAVPLVLVMLDANGNRVGQVGAIRPVGWYNAEHVGSSENQESQRKLIEDARANIRQIRYGKRDAGDATYRVVVTRKTGGSLLHSTDGQRRPLSDMCPTARIAVVTSAGVIDAQGNRVQGQINDEHTLPVGMVVEVRDGATPNQPVVLQLEPTTLDHEQVESVMTALMGYLLSNQSEFSQDDVRRLFGKLYDKYSGLAGELGERVIGRSDGAFNFAQLLEYIGHFVYVRNIDARISRDPVSVANYVNKSDKFPAGPYFVKIGNDLYVGFKGQGAEKYGLGQAGGCVKLNQYLLKDSKTNTVLEQKMEVVHQLLSLMRTNTLRSELSKELFTVAPNEQGQLRVVKHNSYEGFQRYHYLTDVAATNVGTEEDPIYATMHNPAIYIEPGVAASESSTPESTASDSALSEHELAMRAINDPLYATSDEADAGIMHVARKLVAGEALTAQEEIFYRSHDTAINNKVNELKPTPARHQAASSISSIAAPPVQPQDASSPSELSEQDSVERVTDTWVVEQMQRLGYDRKTIDTFLRRYKDIIIGMPLLDFLQTRIGRLLTSETRSLNDDEPLTYVMHGKKAKKGTNVTKAVQRITKQTDAAASAFYAFNQALAQEIARFQQESEGKDNPNWDELSAAIEHLVHAHGLQHAVEALRISETELAKCIPALLSTLPGSNLALTYVEVFNLLAGQVNDTIRILGELLGTMKGKAGADASQQLVTTVMSQLMSRLSDSLPLFDRRMGQPVQSAEAATESQAVADAQDVDADSQDEIRTLPAFNATYEEIAQLYSDAPAADTSDSTSKPEVPVHAEDLGDPFADLSEPSAPDSVNATPLPEVPVRADELEELGNPFADSQQDAPPTPIDSSEETRANDDESEGVEVPHGGGDGAEEQVAMSQQIKEDAARMVDAHPEAATDDEVTVLLQVFQLLASYPNVNWSTFTGTRSDGEQMGFLDWIVQHGGINPNDYPHVFLERVAPTGGNGRLTKAQQSEVASFVAQAILVGYDINQLGRISRKDLQKLASFHLVKLLGPVMANAEVVRKSMDTLVKEGKSSNPQLLQALEHEMLHSVFALIDDEALLEAIVVEASNRLGEAIGLHQRQMETYSETASVEEIFDEWSSDGLDVRAFDAASIEVNHRHGMPLPLRVLLSTMPQTTEAGSPDVGVFGLQRSMPIDKVISIIETAIGAQQDSTAAWEDLMDRLVAASKDYPFLIGLVNRLEKGKPEVRKMFVYHFAKHMLTSQEVVYELVRGTYRMYVNDAHGAEMAIAHQARWAVQYRRSAIFRHGENGELVSNAEEMRAAKELLESAFQVHENGIVRSARTLEEVNVDAIRRAFLKLGLDLDARTIQELLEHGVKDPRDGKYYAVINVSAPFAPGKGGTMYSLLGHAMNLLSKGAEDDGVEVKPLFNNGTRKMLTHIAQMDAHHRGYVRVRSFRDGDHTVNGFTNGMMVHDLVRMFTHERSETGTHITNFRDSYTTFPFSARSAALEYLMGHDPAMKGFEAVFGVDHIALNSLHRKGDDVRDPYVELTPAEMLVVQLGLLQGDVGSPRTMWWEHNGTGVQMRPGRILFPTLSDKGTALAFRAQVVHMGSKNFSIGEHKLDEQGFIAKPGEVQLKDDEVLDFILDQCVMPEYDRMVHFAKKRANGDRIEVEGLDSGSRLFLMLPVLNTIEVTVPDGDGTVRNVQFIELVDETGGNVPDDALDQFREKARRHVLELVQQEAQAKVEMLRDGGLIDNLHKGLDESYAEQLGFDSGKHTVDQLAMFLCLDLTVNEMVGRANQQMLFIGDPALFAKGKFKTAEEHYGRTLEEYEAYTQAMDSNMGKRLAQLIAPGQHPADLRGTYNQIVAEDHIEISSTYPYLVGLFYGQDAVKEAEDLLQAYRSDQSTDHGKDALRQLAEKFPAIAPYLETNGTDAQEYTTALEHVEILYGQGRISGETYHSLVKKINDQMDFEANNPDKPIPEDLYLTQAELQTVFQPLKPVHSGVVLDNTLGMARTMYVKSSSYPLLPQVTAGTQLDGVRRLLEATERETGLRTHLVYASGMKVGGPTTKLPLFNADGTFNTEITPEMVQESMAQLDRAYYRIQQDVPYEAHQDVAMLSQMHRLLFSSGMIDEDGFELEGNTYNGRELYQLYQDTVSELVGLLRDELYDELGLTKDGLIDPDRIDETLTRLRNLFMREASGMPEMVIESLRLEEVRERQPDGSYKVVGMRFATPIFLTQGAVPFERLMMNLVKQRIAKLRLPGYSFVAASSAGYRRVDGSALSDKQRSRIVYTSHYDGQLRGVNFGEHQNPFASRLDKTDTELTDGALVEYDGKRYILCNAGLYSGILVGMDGVPLGERVKYDNMKALGHYPIAQNKKGTRFIVDDQNRIISVVKGEVRYAESSKARAYILSQVPHLEGNEPHRGKAQVLIPCKIRDEHGKLIELFLPDGKPNPQYVKVDEKTGQLSLREDMFDPELLSQVFCRIPSGSHASMASLEIVGFLPPECGDMMVVPPGLTTQTGMDFDIDKETAYGLHVHVHRNTGFVGVFNRDKTPSDRRKMAENRIVRIHQAVYSNPSSGVQRHINRPLSIAFAKSQVDLLASANGSIGSPYFGTYQAHKTRSGQVGRESVGVYANAITLMGQIQSFPEETRFYYTSATGVNHPVVMTIGGVASDGVLNRTHMLGHGQTRTVSEVLEECLNLATDNAKEEALDKLGVSMETINAHVAMVMLGFDKAMIRDNNGNRVEASIPFMFLSQPIIRDFASRRTLSKGQFSSRQSKAAIFDALVEEYNLDLPSYADILKKYGSFAAYNNALGIRERDMAQIMYNNIQDGKHAHAKNMLVQFMTLEELSETIIPYTQVAAIRNKGLGTSKAEHDELLETLDFIKKELSYTEPRVEKSTQGELHVSGLRQLIEQDGKPTHLARQIEAMDRAMQTLRSFTLPSDVVSYENLRSEMRSRAFRRGRPLSSWSADATAELMGKMEADLQAYAASLATIGLWADAETMRKDLMREAIAGDSSHLSLGKYILDAMGQTGPVAKMLRANPFLASLRIEVGGKDGLDAFAPTTIGLDLQLGQRLDDKLFTHAIRELYHNDYKLPDRNGKPYSTRELVKELLAYSLLEGGHFGARKFFGLFPAEVLAETMYSTALQGASDNFASFVGQNSPYASQFTTQFFQHHPEYAMPVNLNATIPTMDGQENAWRIEPSAAQMQTLVMVAPSAFSMAVAGKLDAEAIAEEVPFISVRQNNGTLALFRLVESTEEEARYERIDTLGRNGMTEYNANHANSKPPRTILGIPAVQEPLVPGIAQEPNANEVTSNLPIGEMTAEIGAANRLVDHTDGAQEDVMESSENVFEGLLGTEQDLNALDC